MLRCLRHRVSAGIIRSPSALIFPRPFPVIVAPDAPIHLRVERWEFLPVWKPWTDELATAVCWSLHVEFSSTAMIALPMRNGIWGGTAFPMHLIRCARQEARVRLAYCVCAIHGDAFDKAT
jgi:hypothetical protein